MREINEYLRMMRVIRAEELLALSAAVGLGSGSMKKSHARHVRSEWLRDVNSNKVQRATARTPLSTVGIRVVRVRRTPDGDEH